MRSSSKFLTAALAAALLLSACGSSASSSSSSQPAKTHNASPRSGPLIRTASNAKLGMTVLVNAQGLTLYSLSGERNGKFICTSAACVHVWHPLAVGNSTPSGSISSLGKVTRPGGATQVTYKGMPLYTFANDTAPGQANGQGIKDVGTWSAVATSAAGAPAAPATTTSSGHGYGY